MPITRTTPSSCQENTLVLDNGAYMLKAGHVSSAASPLYDACSMIPNCIARSSRDKRSYIASELESCNDFGELTFRRPVEKGFIVNWEAEKAIWEHEFMDDQARVGLKCEPQETNLILTEKPNCPRDLQKNCDEIVFEQFEFAAYFRAVGGVFSSYNRESVRLSDTLPECLLLIDTSYSDTTILPMYKGALMQSSVRRLTVGGKFMTNYLKELSSLRHYNMMDETHLLNEIKEAISYVAASSQQFSQDLGRTWRGRVGDRRKIDSSIVVDYILPDYENSTHGYARSHDASRVGTRRKLQATLGPREDVLTLGNERFAVPELMFHPADIGLSELGLPEAVVESVSALPEALRAGLLANVLVVGGNSLIAGFMERLEADLRALVPAEMPLVLRRAKNPIKHIWLGAAEFASRPERLEQVLVSKAEYEERGSAWLSRRFAGENL